MNAHGPIDKLLYISVYLIDNMEAMAMLRYGSLISVKPSMTFLLIVFCLFVCVYERRPKCGTTGKFLPDMMKEGAK